MSAICVYLSLPPYLAQWYAHTCRKVHHREDDICPNQPIPLLTPVEPIRGSYESQVLHRVLQKISQKIYPLMQHWLWLFPPTRIATLAFSTISVLTPNRNCRALSWSPLIFACGRSCTRSGCASIGRIMPSGLSWRSMAFPVTNRTGMQSQNATNVNATLHIR